MTKHQLTYLVAIVFGLMVSIKAYSQKPSAFWHNHAILMIYSSTCPYCHKQAQVLSNLKAQTHLPLMLYSVDDKPLAPFRQYQKADIALLKSAFPDGQTSYPALFIVNLTNLNLYPIAQGFLEMGEFVERVSVLSQKILSHEKEVVNG